MSSAVKKISIVRIVKKCVSICNDMYIRNDWKKTVFLALSVETRLARIRRLSSQTGGVAPLLRTTKFRRDNDK